MEVLLRGVNFFTGSIKLCKGNTTLSTERDGVVYTGYFFSFNFFGGVDIMTFQKQKNNLLFLLDSVWI